MACLFDLRERSGKGKKKKWGAGSKWFDSRVWRLVETYAENKSDSIDVAGCDVAGNKRKVADACLVDG